MRLLSTMLPRSPLARWVAWKKMRSLRAPWAGVWGAIVSRARTELVDLYIRLRLLLLEVCVRAGGTLVKPEEVSRCCALALMDLSGEDEEEGVGSTL